MAHCRWLSRTRIRRGVGGGACVPARHSLLGTAVSTRLLRCNETSRRRLGDACSLLVTETFDMAPTKRRHRVHGGVLYIGHIPHGFYESQMKGFFSQFGRVRHVFLARSRRTCRSRGYAFVHFDDAKVAHIVAETMDGYLLFGRRLVVRELPPERLHRAARLRVLQRSRPVSTRVVERQRFLRDQAAVGAAQSNCCRRRKLEKRLESLGVPFSAQDVWRSREVLALAETS
jgi:nucleolar protein 15